MFNSICKATEKILSCDLEVKQWSFKLSRCNSTCAFHFMHSELVDIVHLVLEVERERERTFPHLDLVLNEPFLGMSVKEKEEEDALEHSDPSTYTGLSDVAELTDEEELKCKRLGLQNPGTAESRWSCLLTILHKNLGTWLNVRSMHAITYNFLTLHCTSGQRYQIV